MAKKITKKINSNFNPSVVGGYPVYSYGGRMYGVGGLMMPTDLQQQGFDYASKNGNWNPQVNKVKNEGIGSLGNIAGNSMEQSGQLGNPTKPNWGGNILGGATKGAAAGSMLGPWGTVAGGIIGAGSGLIKSFGEKEQFAGEQEAFIQQRNQQMSQNLPGQHAYVPTFADGGKIPKQGHSDAWGNFYKLQPSYTNALANKYPNIPIKDILTQSVADSTFSNKNVDKYANNLINQYGDFSLDSNEMDSIANANGSDIRNIEGILAGYDSNTFGNTVKTGGTKEDNSRGMRFGPRMMLHRRFDKGNTPYGYLDQKAMGGKINPTQVKHGQAEEMEHTSSPKEAKKVAMDHLKERADYYKILKKAGLAESYANGGGIDPTISQSNPDMTTNYEAGGQHIQNINGGVKIGANALVEQGETRWDSPTKGSYIFSDKIPYKKK